MLVFSKKDEATEWMERCGEASFTIYLTPSFFVGLSPRNGSSSNSDVVGPNAFEWQHFTVFEFHRKNIIQHGERSELAWHFWAAKISFQMPKIVHWEELGKPEAGGQTVLHGSFIMRKIDGKWHSWKKSNTTSGVIFQHCDTWWQGLRWKTWATHLSIDLNVLRKLCLPHLWRLLVPLQRMIMTVHFLPASSVKSSSSSFMMMPAL